MLSTILRTPFIYSLLLVSISLHAAPQKSHNSSTSTANQAYQTRAFRQILPKKSNPITFVSAFPRFDLPVMYNTKVQKWVRYFQTNGKSGFARWIARSTRYKGLMKNALKKRGLPQDLFYIAMIESGLSAKATSHAQAAGYWQFIKPTAHRYGLRVNWWLDERRDFAKSTFAAASYLEDLYKMFKSWYLTASAYNMGEGRLQKLIQKHKTTNFWELARKKDFPKETRDYIPKIIAALLIAKAPRLYGFDKISPILPHSYDFFYAPGGTDLINLARFLKINKNTILSMNPELTQGFIPKSVNQHRIRIPKGYTGKVTQFLRKTI